jgi:class 3 adenylate cyclase
MGKSFCFFFQKKKAFFFEKKKQKTFDYLDRGDAIDIAGWLRGIGLAEHADSFRAERIDAAVLPKLSDADLRELGLPLGDRKKLRAAIEALGAAPAAEPARTAGEQRHLTVMFCDLIDSTRLAATLELETLQRVIEAYQRQVSTCVAGYDGFVAKFLGDGVLVYFGYPRAHEDDAERAVRAGLDIAAAMPGLRPVEGLELGCRVGIASGVVVVGDSIAVGGAAEQAVLGETPNLAARLQAAAPRNGAGGFRTVAAGVRAKHGDRAAPRAPVLDRLGDGVAGCRVVLFWPLRRSGGVRRSCHRDLRETRLPRADRQRAAASRAGVVRVR